MAVPPDTVKRFIHNTSGQGSIQHFNSDTNVASIFMNKIDGWVESKGDHWTGKVYCSTWLGTELQIS